MNAAQILLDNVNNYIQKLQGITDAIPFGPSNDFNTADETPTKEKPFEFIYDFPSVENVYSENSNYPEESSGDNISDSSNTYLESQSSDTVSDSTYSQSNYDFSKLRKMFNLGINNTYMNKAINYWKSKGLNKKQIAALLANGIAESGWNPSSVNRYGYSGVFQWSKRQRNNFQLDIDSQLAYITQEVLDPARGKWNTPGNGWNPRYYKIWTNPNASVSDITKAFSDGYERHGNNESTKQRIKIAKVIYEML